MTTWELIVQKARDLPPDKQREVLDFLEFLLARLRSRGPRRRLRGLWADLDVDITAEDIETARREMWGGFPRQDA